MGDELFGITVIRNGDGMVVHLSGELDLAAAAAFRRCLHALSAQCVVLDFTHVTFLDSTALGVLVAARKRADHDGGNIVLHGVQPVQMKVLEIVGLTKYLSFDGDAEEVQQELVTAARQAREYPTDQTNEG